MMRSVESSTVSKFKVVVPLKLAGFLAQ